ncbi:MAG: hypothetical protein ACRBCI_03605 [Cellvibrionaceae bacterium]
MSITISRLFITLYYTLFILFAGCSSPAEKLQQQALASDLNQLILTTNKINLIAYDNDSTSKQERVYVYLEGDGSPWEKGYWPASDPNTKRSIVLPLLKQLEYPSLYIARPCYGWGKMPANCTTELWTSARYSQDIVNILNEGLNQYKLLNDNIKEYVIIGHSGGGTLASLLASTRSDIVAIVTLAANLDHNAWTQHFGYLPLERSLNPIKYFPLPEKIIRWHLIAGKDKVIPESILKRTVKTDRGSKQLYYSEFDHRCCWQTIWKGVTTALEKELTRRE